MGRPISILGLSDHYGWAAVVAIAVRDGEPAVIDRRRIELIEPGISKHPYHHETLNLDMARAEELVQAVRESALRSAERALSGLRSVPGVAEECVAIVLRDAPLPRLPGSVAEAHASYYVTVRADGMIYHDALCRAAASLGIAVEWIGRGEERRRAAVLQTTEASLDRWLARLRDSLGPPWGKDQQDAAARAIAVLGSRVALRLPDLPPSQSPVRRP